MSGSATGVISSEGVAPLGAAGAEGVAPVGSTLII